MCSRLTEPEMATQSVSCVRDVREASQLLQQLTAEEVTGREGASGVHYME